MHEGRDEILTWKIEELKLDCKRAALRFPLVTNLHTVPRKSGRDDRGEESIVRDLSIYGLRMIQNSYSLSWLVSDEN
jgi:hypothetical protein